jgi:hypothetical protein
MSAIPLLIRRVVNRVGRPLGINPFPRAFEYDLSGERSSMFDQIAKDNHWGSEQSASGVGSELETTTHYRAALVNLIRERNFTSMFDAPCGDLNWMPHVLDQVAIRYEGGDISAGVIAHAKQRHPELSLRQFDICKDDFPKVDVWHCRDCLFHMPFADIKLALANFLRSDIPYALFTTHRARFLHRNLDITRIGFRMLDLERAPFDLPPALAYLPDYRVGSDFPRYVGLWPRDAIQKALEAM